MYPDKQTVTWEDAVSYHCRQELLEMSMDGPEVVLPLDGRIVVTFRFNLARPKSTPKAVEYPITGADVDNLGKAVLDALQNAGIMTNDRRVTDFIVRKRYADEDHPLGVEIEVLGWGAVR